MRARWNLWGLVIVVAASAGCATHPDIAPGVVWVAEFNSSKFGPVSNAFAYAGDCEAWRRQYRATRCLRAHFGVGEDRWLFPVRTAGDEPGRVYFGAPQREACEAMAATLPRNGMQAAGGCQPYKVVEDS